MKEIKATMAGNVWKVNVNIGDKVSEGDDIVILESMKMEIPVTSQVSGIVKDIKVNEGDFINEEEVIALIE